MIQIYVLINVQGPLGEIKLVRDLVSLLVQIFLDKSGTHKMIKKFVLLFVKMEPGEGLIKNVLKILMTVGPYGQMILLIYVW